MKKYVLLGIILSTLVTAGCSRNEILDTNEDSAISFENIFLDRMTKGSEVTTGITQFYVHGIMMKGDQYGTVFDNTEVYISRQTGLWTYSPIQYWYPGATYWFKAVNLPVGDRDCDLKMEKIDPKLNGAGWISDTKVSFSNVGGNTLKTMGGAKTAAPGDNDLIIATKSMTVNGYPGEVSLHFLHALARMRFAFQNNLGSVYTLKVSDVNVDNAITSGVVTLNEPSVWEVTEKDSKLNLNFGKAGFWNESNTAILRDEIQKGETGTSASKYVIPGNPIDAAGKTTAYHVSFHLDIYLDGVIVKSQDFSAVLPVVAGGQLQGKSYNYTASISMETLDLDAIEFQVSTEKWGNSTTGNINVE